MPVARACVAALAAAAARPDSLEDGCCRLKSLTARLLRVQNRILVYNPPDDLVLRYPLVDMGWQPGFTPGWKRLNASVRRKACAVCMFEWQAAPGLRGLAPPVLSRRMQILRASALRSQWCARTRQRTGRTSSTQSSRPAILHWCGRALGSWPTLSSF